MAEQHMLSTIDNPFNPFTHYDLWEEFDSEAGYYTPAYLARVAKSSDELSEPDQDLALEEAIDEIVQLNPQGNYIKVAKPKEDEVT